MNVAIYSRVSTSQQAEHGYSLETQIDACRKKALEMGATSIKEYTHRCNKNTIKSVLTHLKCP